MGKNTNYLQLALDLRRGQWLIYGAESLLPLANDFLTRRLALQPSLEEYAVSSFALSDSGDVIPGSAEDGSVRLVVVVPLHGALTKYDTCDTYGTTGIAAKMDEFINDDEVVGFVLDIDSPGGAENAIFPIVSAIARARAAGKPVIAHCDSCYSAAYWVASQCDAIFADNARSGFGSIGAYAQILDDREDKATGYKIITIYAPESKDKNLAYREALDGKTEKMEEQLSELVSAFHAAVKAGRPSLKADADGVMTGATFKAEKSIELGLADGIGSMDECIENVFIRSEYSKP